MSLLAECPFCHKKQNPNNKKCTGTNYKSCGVHLDQAKKSRSVRYWITYRRPGGKQKRESVAAIEGLAPYSIEDARGALAKCRVQKKEGRRMFDLLPESDITFSELAEW